MTANILPDVGNTVAAFAEQNKWYSVLVDHDWLTPSEFANFVKDPKNADWVDAQVTLYFREMTWGEHTRENAIRISRNDY